MELRKGRPHEFDEDAALEAAMRVFWEKSYDGATMSELTEAVGINRSSEAALKMRLQQARSDGELPGESQPADFARYLSSVMAGLGIQAANGATKAELRRVAAIALRCIEACFNAHSGALRFSSRAIPSARS